MGSMPRADTPVRTSIPRLVARLRWRSGQVHHRSRRRPREIFSNDIMTLDEDREDAARGQ